MAKRRKEEVGDLVLPVNEAVANGPSRQGSSQTRWACTNCGGHDRSFDIIGANFAFFSCSSFIGCSQKSPEKCSLY